ncbi:rho-related GTP-binding protein RhoD isoform X2 [Artibeus jamaicensis]|uniref:rho-related GTP-binding protein RhoD isoform X2 n=1 Tax=Artibeus jamaicensis TaxID=9417 RepID=UPI00235A5B56|nr:rho-related GTP-binding protein RhoD isoform X2 [Artibeus jamaicensis]
MKASQAADEEAPLGARSVKVVLVGDGGCGKTSLLMVFAEGAFPESYTPTVFERLTVNLQMKGKPVHLQIWDTAGQVDYDRLRPLFYPDASVLLLCFDVTSPHSFDNVFNRIPSSRVVVQAEITWSFTFQRAADSGGERSLPPASSCCKHVSCFVLTGLLLRLHISPSQGGGPGHHPQILPLPVVAPRQVA